MKAYHGRSQVKHYLKPLLVKTRKRIAWLRHGAQAELIIISSETVTTRPAARASMLGTGCTKKFRLNGRLLARRSSSIWSRVVCVGNVAQPIDPSAPALETAATNAGR